MFPAKIAFLAGGSGRGVALGNVHAGTRRRVVMVVSNFWYFSSIKEIKYGTGKLKYRFYFHKWLFVSLIVYMKGRKQVRGLGPLLFSLSSPFGVSLHERSLRTQTYFRLSLVSAENNCGDKR